MADPTLELLGTVGDTAVHVVETTTPWELDIETLVLSVGVSGFGRLGQELARRFPEARLDPRDYSGVRSPAVVELPTDVDTGHLRRLVITSVRPAEPAGGRTTPDFVAAVMVDAIRIAVNAGARRIGLPLLWAGEVGLGSEDIAEAMASAVVVQLSQAPLDRLLALVLFDEQPSGVRSIRHAWTALLPPSARSVDEEPASVREGTGLVSPVEIEDTAVELEGAVPLSSDRDDLPLSPAAQRLVGWALSLQWDSTPPPWPIRLTMAALAATTQVGENASGIPLGLVRTLPGPAARRVDAALLAMNGMRGHTGTVPVEVTWDQTVIPSVGPLARSVGATAVEPHHLLAAALTSQRIPDDVLRALGVTQANLVHELRKEIDQDFPEEPRAVWDAQLGTAASKLPGDLGVLAMLGWAATVRESSPQVPASTAVLLGALAWAEASLDRSDVSAPDPALQRFFRQLESSTAQLRTFVAEAFSASGIDRPTAMTHPDAYAAGLLPVLAEAERVADATGAGSQVSQRHLVAAALVLGGLTDPLIGAIGMDAGELRLQLYLAVADLTDEPPQQWLQVLGLDRLDTRFATDYVPVRRRAPARLDQAGLPPLEDHLDVDVYVAMLAATVMRRSTAMPLSIGLFGEWGSGKSYFMELLRQRVDALSSPGDAPSAYMSSVIQVTFNAWNYADTNLWASLAAEFFTQLGAPDVDPDDVRRASIAQELRDKSLIRVELEEARQKAEERERTARAEYVRAMGDRERKSRTLSVDLLEAVLADDGVQQSLSELRTKSGLRDAPAQTLRLAESLGDLGYDAAATRRVIGQQSLRTPFLLLVSVIVIIFMAVLVTPSDAIGKVLGAGTLATIGTVLGLAGNVVAKARTALQQLRTLATRAEAARQGVLKGGDVAERATALRQAQAAELVARARLAELDGAVSHLEHQLDDLQPGRRLYQFIAERAASTEYRGQLGVVSSVRRDFEQLVDLMRRWRESPSAQQTPIDRIVLYIDDLDRCEPDQVVQVLQAVHLLLAMDLFVVVVGVDPNWLLHSLRQRYRGVLDPSAPTDADASVMLAHSPQSYLEKIFQIPFALPRMTDTSFSRLMASMTAPSRSVVPDPPAPTTTGTGEPERVGAIDRDESSVDATGPTPDDDLLGAPAPSTSGSVSGRRDADGDLDNGGTATVDAPVLPPEAGSEIATGLDATDRRSTVTAAEIVSTPVTRRERELLNQLAPLVRSPRAATRLFNIYGMLRSTTNLTQGQSFLGGPGQPGAYQAVAQLLGVLTADPELLGILLYGRTAPDGPPVGICRPTGASATWPQVVDSLLPAKGASGTWANAVATDLDADEVDRWRRIHRGLAGLQPAVTLHDIEPYRVWGPQIARFSFILSPHLDDA
ncbi:MAG: P-loop NTPase fold protein [Lapillicoccus sp.]